MPLVFHTNMLVSIPFTGKQTTKKGCTQTEQLLSHFQELPSKINPG